VIARAIEQGFRLVSVGNCLDLGPSKPSATRVNTFRHLVSMEGALIALMTRLEQVSKRHCL